MNISVREITYIDLTPPPSIESLRGVPVNTIFNEDCLDTMARLPSNSIGLVVTSPPYDNLRIYKGFIFDYKKVLQGLYRIMKPGGVVVWVVGDSTNKGSESGMSFRQALFAMDCGFNLHDTMIYLKSNPVPLSHNRYEQYFEYMFVFSKGKPGTFNPIKIPCITAGSTTNRKHSKANEQSYSVRARKVITTTNLTKIKGNVWEMSVGTGDRTMHNAPFPMQLAEDHILSWSNPGDTVYDPFSGSGTTAKMALLNNRHYLGSEISTEYHKESEKRIQEATR